MVGNVGAMNLDSVLETLPAMIKASMSAGNALHNYPVTTKSI